MKELLLTDEEAQRLIEIMKVIAKQHNVTLTNKTSGQIDIVGTDNKRFFLNYFYSHTNKVFQFRETEHNYTLIRINLNDKFHKNADGTKVWGNRINIFSEEEYYAKSDEVTHCKAYPLPYESISDSTDFFQILDELLDYSHTDKQDRLTITIQENLL